MAVQVILRDDVPNLGKIGEVVRVTKNPTGMGVLVMHENTGLTATHTLFAREHNRIVGLLPNTLTQQQKFDIARRIVIAEQQYVTYNEFLPTMGVALPKYTGYNPNVRTSLSDEFATVGYRAHSQVHGEFELEADASRYTASTLAALKAQGVEVTPTGNGELTIASEATRHLRGCGYSYSGFSRSLMRWNQRPTRLSLGRLKSLLSNWPASRGGDSRGFERSTSES